MLKEFRDFILRGNVIDLAVAVVIGAAFKAIVDALVKDLITPLIAAIGGQPDFSAVSFTVNGSRFLIGDFINNIVSFLIIAAVIFFLVVKPINLMMTRASRKTADGAPPAPTKEEVLLTEIRDALIAQNGTTTAAAAATTTRGTQTPPTNPAR
jgi:large conductance mechanosensitive channel